MAPRVPEETKRLAAELLKAGNGAAEVKRLLAQQGAQISVPTITRQADRLGITLRQGPRAGNGGRRPKGAAARVNRGVALEPSVWQLIEDRRREGETLSDALGRILCEDVKQQQ